MGFKGFKRLDGKVGVRNYALVISSVSCANGVVAAIGRAVARSQNDRAHRRLRARAGGHRPEFENARADFAKTRTSALC